MKATTFRKIEFWAATLIFVILAFQLVSDTSRRSDGGIFVLFLENKISYSYFYNFFLPRLSDMLIIYFSFLALNFILIPSLINREREWLNYSLVILLTVLMGIVFGVSKTHSHTYELMEYRSVQQGYNSMFFEAFRQAIFLTLAILIYGVAKPVVVYAVSSVEQNELIDKQMKRDVIFGLGLWLAGLLLCIVAGLPMVLIVMWGTIVLAGVAVVIYSLYYLLPRIHAKDKGFMYFLAVVFLISFLLFIPQSIVSYPFFRRDSDAVVALFLFHIPIQLLISAPFAWFLYKRRQEDRAEITSLRTELGRSDANLNFLKSQINPHFLFNALNTLYGTALQEHAERTSEGIQKLGDMMRFMLHENTQDKISLVREIDYLNNYISLQKLRAAPASDIKIETLIEEQFDAKEIAPMLLIPFVENAFKHGISLQKPSHIKISLQVREGVLYFDVSNSINPKNDNDPEKLKSGVGLENVQQRLQLLYKGKHDLIIRERVNEYFVHLTLTL